MGWLLALLLLLGTAVPSFANPKSSPAVLAAFREVVAKPSESTVRVLCDDKEAALGTIVAADGWIITKATELKSRISCKLRDGRSFVAKIVGVEDKHDLALLKIEAKGLKPIEWADSRSAVVGNWLASPGTGAEPVAIGVVSVAARKPSMRDMPLPNGGRDAGYLGVALSNDESAAKIERVEPKSPADKAGLKAGDVVLKVSGKVVKDPGSLVALIGGFKAGKTVRLQIKRGDKIEELQATLAKRPSSLFNRADFQNNMGSKLSDRRGGFPTILQHDQVIKPTDCGGPVVDLDGKAVGINIARAGRVESYAIPTESVLALLPDLKSGKLAPKEEPAPPAPAVADLEKALEKARADMKSTENALRGAEEARKATELRKKQLEDQLAAARKKVAEAQTALDQARKDATKK
jgi:serine protease Do